MTRKIIIVAAIMWLAALLGGGLWGELERRLLQPQTSPGVLKIRELQSLYGARLFEEALAECERVEADPQYVEQAPQILYIRWVVNRQLARQAESDRVHRLFLDRYPQHPLVADLRFATAMGALAAGEYAQAERELGLIEKDYPDSTVAAKAKGIRQRLRRVATTAPSMR